MSHLTAGTHGFPALPNPQPARILCATMITDPKSSLRAGGIRLRTRSAETLAAASQSFLAQLAQLGLQHDIETTDEIPSPEGGVEKSFHLRAELAQKWAPGLDTTNLTALLQLDTANRADDLDREILLTLLLSPVAFEFPGHAELAAAVRIRRNLVVAGRKTALAFHTTEVDRPEDCWTYTSPLTAPPLG
ncbi:MAG: hypothetical protein JJD98_09800 [Polaromonas sp.]|nr:hypothetical protein [Polaromonas sp.]